MTPAIALGRPSPVQPTLTYARDADNAASVRSATDGFGQNCSGLWLRHATAGLCVIAAVAIAVSFIAKYVGAARTALSAAAVVSRKGQPR